MNSSAGEKKNVFEIQIKKGAYNVYNKGQTHRNMTHKSRHIKSQRIISTLIRTPLTFKILTQVKLFNKNLQHGPELCRHFRQHKSAGLCHQEKFSLTSTAQIVLLPLSLVCMRTCYIFKHYISNLCSKKSISKMKVGVNL